MLTKPEVEAIIESPPVVNLDDMLSLQFIVVEGIDSQISLFKAVIGEAKRL